jgi:predicted transposase YbfD/YdcC
MPLLCFAQRGTAIDAAADCGTFDDAVAFLRYFNDLRDPRQRGKVTYPRDEVAEKSNEIIAIPKLPDMVAIEGAIDAMGCRRDIAQKVLDKKAGYVLALQGNRSSLREDVELFAAEQKSRGFTDTKISQATTIDGDHGRIESRTATVIHDVTWLQERHDRPGPRAIVMIESSREISGKVERQTR